MTLSFLNKSRIKRGEKAPDFLLRDDVGREVGLSNFKGRNVVLYFYSKDFTPECITQACEFRNYFDRIAEKAVIFGVSRDDTKTHKNFKKNYDLPFILLSDKKGEVSQAYGVLDDNEINRTTFIINEEGRIGHIFEDVEPRGHGKEILEKL